MGKARIKESILDIVPYAPGVSSHDTGRPITKLSSNENPYGPSPSVGEAIRGMADKVHLYPDKEARALKSRLAQVLGISPECIVVGNGSDEVLENLAKLYLSEGDNLVTHSTFSTYNTIARALGAERRLVPDLPDLSIDDRGLKKACDGKTRMMLVCTPNNPTGAILAKVQLSRLLGFTLDRGIFLVVDEAYADFSERYSSPYNRIIGEDMDAAVVRTFSKAYGLAGLRIGYAIAPPRVVRYLDLVRMPFNASSVAQAAAIAALGDQPYVQRSIERIRRGRRFLADGLAKLGLRCAPSEANFVLASVGGAGFTAAKFAKALLDKGFAVRDCSSFGFPEHVRVTVGTDEQNASFLSAVAEVLS